MKNTFFYLLSFFYFVNTNAQVAVDSVLYAKDSVIEVPEDSTTIFFQSGQKVTNPSKITLVTKSKRTISFNNFIKKELSELQENVLADLDNDKKKELLFYNYTGGMHCCDEIYIFKNIGANKYQFAAKLFAGNVIINSKNIFSYNFYELFGYFYSCYACSLEEDDTIPSSYHYEVRLKYANGKLNIIKGDKELLNSITDRLALLSEQPYQPLEEDDSFDNGFRKEVALNLATYYFSFGKNFTATKILFNKYYKYPDANAFWKRFVETIQTIQQENSF